MRDPIRLFRNWFREAQRSKAIDDATAACLSTVDLAGLPDARMVLIKKFSEQGFDFFTNTQSAKAKAIRKKPRTALTFYWPSLKKQVRLQGTVSQVSDDEADAYWKTRPRLAQIGAWASKQSAVMPSRAGFLKDVARLVLKFGLKPVPRPPFWVGFRILPHKIEFWRGGKHRLHDRVLYTKSARRWVITRLYP